MLYKAHLISSIAVSASFPFLAKEAGINLSFNDLVLILPAIILGGSFPDCDTESIPSRIYAGIGALLTIYWSYTGNYEFIWLIWIPYIAAKIFPHRSWTHKVWFPVAVIFLPLIIELTMFYSKFDIRFIQELITKYHLAVNGFALGVVVHIFCDMKRIRKIVRFIGGDKFLKFLYG